MAGLLASWWVEDGASRVIVEADDGGGILAARWKSAHGLTWQPGLIELATLSQPDVPGVLANSQPIAEGLSVVAAPPSPGQVINALDALGDDGAARLASVANLRVFVDCGRLTKRSAAIHLARRSVVTLIVCRPELEEIYAMLAGVVELRDAGCQVGLVVVGEGAWSATEIADQAQVPLMGVLPRDPKGAGVAASDGLVRSRRLERTALGRAMDDFTTSLQSYCSVRQRPVDQYAPGVSPATISRDGPPRGHSGPGVLSPAMQAAFAVDRSEKGWRGSVDSKISTNGAGYE
ncbi:MAG: hypothetical protein GY926_13585 [bacterium]|nr:hypothetical protein [bacterium]